MATPALDAEGVLRAWEAGRDQHPIDRALTLLLVADPGESRGRLARLSVPERDRRLLELRARTLGPALAVFSTCPTCGERVEFSVSSDALLSSPAGSEVWEVDVRGKTLRFRLPDSSDLAAAAACADTSEARRLLAQRCVVAGSGEDAPPALDDAAVSELADRMAEVAPEADVLFDLACPSCDARWREGLDIAGFFWKELVARAMRVLHEVDTLARAYHWPESDILAMSAARRQSYLELVGA